MGRSIAPTAWVLLPGLWLLLLTCRAELLESRSSWQADIAGRQAYMQLPLRTRNGVTRERALLRSGAMPIGGSVRVTGYFYATIGLGTPARTFDLIIDTGSTISYVPCASCSHCGKHKDKPFDPAASSTSVALTCNAPGCFCGTPACQCKADQCFYTRAYAEHSSSSGFLYEDMLDFPDTAGPTRIVFGCEDDETGQIFSQDADGILGLGNNENAFHAQLVRSGVIDDTFGLCFGYPDGGQLLLGAAPVPGIEHMRYTLLKPGFQMHYYTVELEGITVHGKMVDVPQNTYNTGYGVVMDSGTTFTYLPTRAFKTLSDMLSQVVLASGLQSTPGADPNYVDICWKGADEDDLGKHYPEMTFTFATRVKVTLTPLQYLFKTNQGTFCLGMFDNGAAGTLVGGISMRNVLVQYDRSKKRIGFLPTNCNDLRLLPQPPPQPVTPGDPPGSSSTKASEPSRPLPNAGSESPAPGQTHPDFPVIHDKNVPEVGQWFLDAEGDWVEGNRGDGLYQFGNMRAGNLITAVVVVALVASACQLLYVYRACVYSIFRGGIHPMSTDVPMYSMVGRGDGRAAGSNGGIADGQGASTVGVVAQSRAANVDTDASANDAAEDGVHLLTALGERRFR